MSKPTPIKQTRSSVISSISEVFSSQRAAFARDMNPSLAERIDRLDRLSAMTARIAPQLVEAMSADFGHRSPHVTRLADIASVEADIRHNRRSLAKWMKARRVPTALAFQPAYCRVIPQPLGVVGVVAPWNYPYQLAIGPTVAAIAAGNRVMIKPSELTPRVSELMRSAVEASFSPEEIAVIVGDADVGKSFVALPFDHLLFTGSTEVGRQVAVAAAANLTPVTLELGGKSPAIFHQDFSAELDTGRLAMTKLFNAGQTCIAPDYALVPRERLSEFVAGMQASVSRMYPDIGSNPDYTSIINERHWQRLQALLDDARSHGAEIISLGQRIPGGMPRMMTPALVLNVNDDMRIMQQEIFGPLLPVMVYDTLDEMLAYVNRHPRPLALYWFGADAGARDRVLRETLSGGVTINDCMWHFGQQDLPFGGVGASGMGACHGEAGFRTFSKHKPVFYQSRFSGMRLMYPPYGKVFEAVERVMKFIT
ncbi:coniferyl aldehyde dehydrogenase [Lacisediminimonas profundi]|uniref:coniferyl aldehyde dehydrogenase n=1 Tax=Lacisediminimonas profundi TaxID=2603856 RepID=UPI00124B6233|nr:coniferyl aldehyde dehydrogenase [Lacisediminimonas profundi]